MNTIYSKTKAKCGKIISIFESSSRLDLDKDVIYKLMKHEQNCEECKKKTK